MGVVCGGGVYLVCLWWWCFINLFVMVSLWCVIDGCRWFVGGDVAD